MKRSYLLILVIFSSINIFAKKIIVGAERTALYLPLLQSKRVGILTNHTATVESEHLVDMLRNRGITITKIFSPEHGFRGTAADGQHITNSTDAQTGIPIISLYGNKKKPTLHDLVDVDILLFDMQDVGVRFYTYISSLEYFMEAAAEHNKPLIILDRPNPHGFYIDGPVCEIKSFVGMQPVPIVHGMTLGEYARMLNAEEWLNSENKKITHTPNGKRCMLKVIPCKNYSHKDLYQLPIFPSPNIKSMNTVYLYPSTCLFEGTQISCGRGTQHPFEFFGHPALPHNLFSFTPHKPMGNDSILLRYDNVRCFGYNLVNKPKHTLKKLNKHLTLSWLQKAYSLLPDKTNFFTNYFRCLAGNDYLAQQIDQRMPEKIIRASWQPAIDKFKKIRKKYLLYPDFE